MTLKYSLFFSPKCARVGGEPCQLERTTLYTLTIDEVGGKFIGMADLPLR